MGMPIWMILLLVLILFLLGGSVFSFLNVVIFRMPRGEEFVKTRSHCPGCNRVLTPLELVPVFSYLCLGGRCRDCGSKIGIRDVSIEIFGGLASIASFFVCFQGPVGSMAQGLTGDLYARLFAALTCLGLFGILTVIGFIGLDTGQTPAGTLIALGVLMGAGFFALPQNDLLYSLLGMALAGAVVLALSILTKGLFRKSDSCIPAALGLVFGWSGALLALGTGLLIYGLVCFATRLQKKCLPGATFALCVGGMAGVLAGLIRMVWG